jgi:hypothetical protein
VNAENNTAAIPENFYFSVYSFDVNQRNNSGWHNHFNVDQNQRRGIQNLEHLQHQGAGNCLPHGCIVAVQKDVVPENIAGLTNSGYFPRLQSQSN